MFINSGICHVGTVCVHVCVGFYMSVSFYPPLLLLLSTQYVCPSDYFHSKTIKLLPLLIGIKTEVSTLKSEMQKDKMQRNYDGRKLRDTCSKKLQKRFLKDLMKVHN